MLDSYKHRLRKAAAAFCAAAFLLGSVPAARAASVCPPPQVSAACAALIDGRTGQTLYEKNADRRALIASTTKIMTGLLVCEAGEADRRVTVPSLAVGLEGSSMYLKRGETLTRRDLLYGMMLHSGNDAALTLAISVSGSEQAFVRQIAGLLLFQVMTEPFAPVEASSSFPAEVTVVGVTVRAALSAATSSASCVTSPGAAPWAMFQ